MLLLGCLTMTLKTNQTNDVLFFSIHSLKSLGLVSCQLRLNVEGLGWCEEISQVSHFVLLKCIFPLSAAISFTPFDILYKCLLFHEFLI